MAWSPKQARVPLFAALGQTPERSRIATMKRNWAVKTGDEDVPGSGHVQRGLRDGLAGHGDVDLERDADLVL